MKLETSLRLFDGSSHINMTFKVLLNTVNVFIKAVPNSWSIQNVKVHRSNVETVHCHMDCPFPVLFHEELKYGDSRA
jgi:hypothetical protein